MALDYSRVPNLPATGRRARLDLNALYLRRWLRFRVFEDGFLISLYAANNAMGVMYFDAAGTKFPITDG